MNDDDDAITLRMVRPSDLAEPQSTKGGLFFLIVMSMLIWGTFFYICSRVH